MCAYRFLPQRLFLLAILTAGAALAFPAAGHADGIYVAVDEAEIVKLEAPAAEIIIGNPAFAAVTVQSGDTLVVTGKAFGQTNMIVLDRDGREIMNDRVTVVGTRRVVRINKGGDRYSYLCAPVCRTAPQIGDNAEYFDTTLKQIESKNKLAEEAAAGVAQ